MTKGVKRSADEIVARMAEVSDLFGVQGSDLLEHLSFERAQPFLKDGVTAEQWQDAQAKAGPVERIVDYLPFAWEKANDCRGLSAARSLLHFKTWLWLAGVEPDWLDRELDEYEFYGKPQLVLISEAVGFDWRAVDKGSWGNAEGDRGPPNAERDALIAEQVAKAAELKGLLDG